MTHCIAGLLLGAHVDSLKFSGGIISSLSLLSPRTLRLLPDMSGIPDENDPQYDRYKYNVTGAMPEILEVIIRPRSFYMLSGPFRYCYSHSILGYDQKPLLIPEHESLPDVDIGRRISIMFRDEKFEEN